MDECATATGPRRFSPATSGFQQESAAPGEQPILQLFDHALRCSMEILQHLRDVNAATLMLHFGVPVREESVMRRLQDKGILRKDLTWSEMCVDDAP